MRQSGVTCAKHSQHVMISLTVKKSWTKAQAQQLSETVLPPALRQIQLEHTWRPFFVERILPLRVALRRWVENFVA